jgi:hypothetical protein
VGALANSDVDGKIFLGKINTPDVPTFPAALLPFVSGKIINNSTTISASNTPTTSTA